MNWLGWLGAATIAILAQPAAAQYQLCPPNTVLAGPTGGNAAPPTCRSIQTSDLPPSSAVAGCTGVNATDICLQAALVATGGSILTLQPITYSLSKPLVISTDRQVLNCNGATLQPSATGSNFNLINVGYQTSQVNWAGVKNCRLTGNSPTGGYALSVHNVGNFHAEDVWIDHTFCGVDDERTNADLYEYIWGYTVGNSCQAFYWYANPTGYPGNGQRSDQLTLISVALNAGFYGNDGFVWDGIANTLNMFETVFLETNHGFWVRNTAGNVNWFPQFSSIYDLQVEGAISVACQIDGGRNLHFTDSFCINNYGQTDSGTGHNQGNNDNAALVINPDGAGSVTSNIHFAGGSVGLAAQQCATLDAQAVFITGTDFRSCSQKSSGTKPSVELQYSAPYGSADYGFENIKFCGAYGDTPTTNYGLIRDANVGSVHVNGGNFNYCLTGEIQDNSTNYSLVVVGSTDRNGNPLPPSAGQFVSNAAPSVSSCGSSPSIGGNNLSGILTTGSGSPTSCTITFASTSAGGGTGLGLIKNVIMQGTTAATGAFPVITAASPTGFTFARADGAAMNGQVFYYHVSQGAN